MINGGQAAFTNMWTPPFIILPIGPWWGNVVEAQRQPETRHAVSTGMFPCFLSPRNVTNHLPSHIQRVPAENLSIEEDKKITLKRSVFELVKNAEFLDLADPKLLSWYLNLPADDRKLIQDKGGLQHFLKNHPALDVTRNFVYVRRQPLEEYTYPLPSAMSKDLNKSRRPTYYGVSLCKNCGTSIPFNTMTCRLCCVPSKKPEEKLYLSDQRRELGLLPNSVKEELNFCPSVVLGAPGELRTAQGLADQSLHLVRGECDSCSAPAEAPPYQQGKQRSQAHILNQLWDEEVEKKSAAGTMYKDSSAQASFALDEQLERHGKTPQGVMGSHEQGGYRGHETTEFSGLEKETLPKYCSFNSTSYRNCSDTSQSECSYHSGSGPVSGLLTTAQANSCSPTDSVPCRGKQTPDDRLDDFGMEDSRCGLKNEEFHSVMEEVRSTSWASSWTPTPQGLETDSWMNSRPADQSDALHGEGTEAYHGLQARGANFSSPERDFACTSPSSGGRNSSLAALYDSRSLRQSPQDTMSQSVDVSADFRASYTSTRATEARWSVASRSSNTEPPGATKNAAVNTSHSPPGQDRSSQTTPGLTSEKFVITEVCMADLDYFTEEFIKLQQAQEELKVLQAKLACSEEEAAGSGCIKALPCECSQRAVRAELRLLALQHAMCQQHCWRRYYTSAEGDVSILSMDAPSDNIKSVLQDLEQDYCKMKHKILSGVPLDEQRPLSVDSGRIGSEAAYVPSQIIKDCLLEEEAVGAEQGGSQQPDSQDSGEGERVGPGACGSAETVQTEQSDAPPAVEPRPDGSKSGRAGAPLAQQTAPPPAAPPVDPPAGHKPGGAKDPDSSEAWYDAEEEFGAVSKDHQGTQNEGTGTVSAGKKDVNCFLRVTGLPSDVTEEEVRASFRKYQVSEVNITAPSSDSRVAVMALACPKLAEAAVRDVNGRTVRGQVVKVTSVCRPGNLLPEGPGGSAKPNSRTFLRARRMAVSKSGLSVTAKTLQRRLEKLTNVQDTPTASGTCVPQHYATMGSFDTLMARLMERHPEAGQERIVRAMVELREQNQGLLSGLPLKTIVDMTSDLLTRPSTSTSA